MKKLIKFFLMLFIASNLCSILNLQEVYSMPIEAKDYNHLLGTLDGLSDNQLKQHFELYHGYVKSINTINEQLEKAPPKTGLATYSEYRALDIARPFPNNGVILHEWYFENLNGKKTSPSKTLSEHLQRDFGSHNNYIADLKEAAKSPRSGWVITAYNKRDSKLHNYIIDLHDEHVPLGIVPIMIMDMWEHAYMVDYGIDKKTYVDVFLKNLDWEVVSKRLEAIVK